MEILIPKSVAEVIGKLEAEGFEAFVVGGCVRDLMLGKEPKDWDVTTNALPEEVLKVFPNGKYENKFGTVLVPEKYLSKLEGISMEVELDKADKEKLIIGAQKYLAKVEPGTYDDGHSERVRKYAEEILKDYPEANTDLIELASIYHDVGKSSNKEHISESQNIFRKEAEGILEPNIIEKVCSIIEHDSANDSYSIERQIVVEADLLDGISVERCENAHKTRPEIHFGWIKEYFNNNNLYRFFKTPKGVELLKSSINDFNNKKFGFKLPSYQIKLNRIVEITTYRIESKYSDKRHPDKVKFAKTLKEDLSRRDFCINAIALKLPTSNFQLPIKSELLNSKFQIEIQPKNIIDPFGGREDLKKKLLRAVGDAGERFGEDALRMLRAVRFAVQLDFEIEKKTFESIRKNAGNLRYISKERICDEFEKIVISDYPAKGVDMLVELGLMKHVIPEVLDAVGVRQNRHHYNGPYNTVYKHMLASLEKCPSKKLEVRLAAFLHDIGKPQTKRGEGIEATFHGHEYLGAKMVQRIMERLKFSRKTINKTVLLVKNHMFYYNVDEVGESGVRRVVHKVGLENINDLIDVRIGDRLGSGVPKAVPYKLRHFKYMVEKVSKDAISVGQLKVDGSDLMKELDLMPGPKIGAILDVLLARVIDDQKVNDKQQLLAIAKQLDKQDLKQLRQMAKQKIEVEREKKDEQTKKKYWVQ